MRASDHPRGRLLSTSMREGRVATQQVSIRAGKGSFIEYLPDPLALFPHAHFRSAVRIAVEEGATVIIGDAFGLHDPDAPGPSVRLDFQRNRIPATGRTASLCGPLRDERS